MEIEKQKKCFKCGETKPLSAFYKHSMMADGHLNKCKECNKADVQNNRKEKLEYYQEYDRIRGRDRESDRIKKFVEYSKLPETKAKTNERSRNNAHKYKHKKYIRGVLAKALKSGKIVRPSCCEFCGESCVPNGHHSSYSEEMALIVTWLCTTCHGLIHRDYD